MTNSKNLSGNTQGTGCTIVHKHFAFFTFQIQRFLLLLRKIILSMLNIFFQSQYRNNFPVFWRFNVITSQVLCLYHKWFMHRQHSELLVCYSITQEWRLRIWHSLYWYVLTRVEFGHFVLISIWFNTSSLI